MKALKSALAERVLRSGIRIYPGRRFDFEGVTYTPVVMRSPPRHRSGQAMTILHDLRAAWHAAVLEYRRRRWVRQLVKQSSLPF